MIYSEKIGIKIEPGLSDIARATSSFNGTVDFDGEILRIEYARIDFMGNQHEKDYSEIHVDEIRAVSSGRLGNKIIVKPKQLSVLDTLPGDHADRIVMKVDKGFRKDAQELVGKLLTIVNDRNEYDFAGVPFTLETPYGVTEIKGVLYPEPGYLVIDFRSGLVGTALRNHQIIKVETEAIQKIAIVEGVVRNAILLSATSSALVDALPGRFGPEIRLAIRRRDREEARQLVNTIRSRQSTQPI